MGLRLAKAGYGGGDPEKVLNMTVGWVTAMLQFEAFMPIYERTFVEINKGKQ